MNTSQQRIVSAEEARGDVSRESWGASWIQDLGHTVVAQTEQIAALRRIALDQIPHAYEGGCPDRIEGPDVRDLDCPACQILMVTD